MRQHSEKNSFLCNDLKLIYIYKYSSLNFDTHRAYLRILYMANYKILRKTEMNYWGSEIFA